MNAVGAANGQLIKAPRFVGQPLYAAVCVIVIYAAVRASSLGVPLAGLSQPNQPDINSKAPVLSDRYISASTDHIPDGPVPVPVPAQPLAGLWRGQSHRFLPTEAGVRPQSEIGGNVYSSAATMEAGEPHLSDLHQLLYPSAPSRVSLSGEIAAHSGSGSGSGSGFGNASHPPAQDEPLGNTRRRKPTRDRWSVNGWLLYRPDTMVAVRTGGGPQPSTYGASQAGAVLRYRLSDISRYRPSAYVRATSALQNTRDQELATGISARPLAHVPVTVAAELRASRRLKGTEIRPAIFAYTEASPIRLPLQFYAEVYGQAGYVSGDFATLFADGQLRVDRTVSSFDFGELRAGGGVWAGAQEGASRLDIGPTASVKINMAGAPVRIAADYRYRIAGNARPQSGMAITVSTGF